MSRRGRAPVEEEREPVPLTDTEKQFVEEWKKLGITFTITTLRIDTSIPTGKFIFGIMAQYAELEREQIVERTNLAIKRIKKSLDEKGYYITKEGKKIASLGRPKGKKDKKRRRKSGYHQRWSKN